VLSITPANYRKLNTPRQLCGFAYRAGKAIREIQTFQRTGARTPLRGGAMPWFWDVSRPLPARCAFCWFGTCPLNVFYPSVEN
jgi:hypothetical protein